LAAVTCWPLWLSCAFHPDVTCCVPVHDHVAVHADTAGPPLVTVTLAVNPVLHWFG
jgi:hypothetical protein